MGELGKLLTELHEDALDYQAVFGTVGARGQAVFFDAVPVERPGLEVDVMNPHYGPYYQGGPGIPPADYLSPVPVYFLTVASGARFAFAVAPRPSRLANQTGREEAVLARQACAWLQAALADLGAGGKTSAGYGYWSGFQKAPLDL